MNANRIGPYVFRDVAREKISCLHVPRASSSVRFRSRFIGLVCASCVFRMCLACRPFHTFVLIEWANCQHSFATSKYQRRLSLKCVDCLNKMADLLRRYFS